jgi:hypothetical protein
MEAKEIGQSAKQESAKRRPRAFSSYLIEFIFLFLAVLGGYVVDQLREYNNERDYEIEILTSILEDLRKDRLGLEHNSEFGKITILGADSLISELIKTPLHGREKKLYHFFNLQNTGIGAPYTDRTVVQLKYSGRFNVIRDKKIAEMIVKYEAIANDARFWQYGNAHLNNSIQNILLVSKVFDIPKASIYQSDALENVNSIQNVNYPNNLRLLTYDEATIMQLRNLMFQNRFDDVNNLNANRDLLKLNRALDSTICVSYNLK